MVAISALFVGCLQIIIAVTAAEHGRFDGTDDLGDAPEDLQYAFIIFKHGIRSPIHNIFGSEGDYSKMWPDGEGALTEEGKQLMGKVGRSLRTRYDKLVPHYNEKQVEVTSTDSPRASESASAVAAGMFPPPESAGEDSPDAEEVPVTNAADFDKYNLLDDADGDSKCARYAKKRDEIISKEMENLSKGQKKNLKIINDNLEASNAPIKTINSMDDLFNVWDEYYTEELSGKSTQPWAKKQMSKMTQLAQFRMWNRMFGGKYGPDSTLQFFTGPLFNQILTEMIQQHADYYHALMGDEAPVHPQGGAHLHLHGSHDPTVAALVWALVDQKNYMAAPGDTLILETNLEEEVKLYLYSPLNRKKLQELSLKKLCEEKNCSFENLIKGLKRRSLSYSEEVWEQRCSESEEQEESQEKQESEPAAETQGEAQAEAEGEAQAEAEGEAQAETQTA